MPDPHHILIPRKPFTSLSIGSSRGGVVLLDRDGLGLATVLVRKDKSEVLAQRLHEQYGIELPQRPQRIAAGDISLVATGPGAWLAVREHGGNAFAAELMEKIGDVASVSDQSDGYAVLRIGGPKVRETLAKMFSIDFHSRAFKPGDVAVTVAAHIGATLWRLEDNANGSPVFEIAVFRSLAADFWHVLSASAAEFGM